jgi:hypothetical protein
MGKLVILSGYFYDGINVTYTPSEEPIDIIKKYFSDNGWEFGVTIFNEKQGKRMLKELTRLYNAQPETKPKDYTRLGDLMPYFKCNKVSYGKLANKEFRIFLSDSTETN